MGAHSRRVDPGVTPPYAEIAKPAPVPPAPSAGHEPSSLWRAKEAVRAHLRHFVATYLVAEHRCFPPETGEWRPVPTAVAYEAATPIYECPECGQCWQPQAGPAKQ
jgi:hypothetical protein